MLRTGQSPAPSMGRSSSASTPGSHSTPGVLLPGTLASPQTGLAPAGCRELVARLRRGTLLSVLLGAELLAAHSSGITLPAPPRPNQVEGTSNCCMLLRDGRYVDPAHIHCEVIHRPALTRATAEITPPVSRAVSRPRSHVRHDPVARPEARRVPTSTSSRSMSPSRTTATATRLAHPR
jgi:hypothetical protein